MSAITSNLSSVTLINYIIDGQTDRSLHTFMSDEAVGFIRGLEAAGRTVHSITAIFSRTLVIQDDENGINHSLRTVIVQKCDSATFINLCKKANEDIPPEEWLRYMLKIVEQLNLV